MIPFSAMSYRKGQMDRTAAGGDEASPLRDASHTSFAIRATYRAFFPSQHIFYLPL